MKSFYLLLYYGFARYLPKSTHPIFGKVSKTIRRVLCQRIFASCGSKLNVENNAYFGNGKDFRVGEDVGIGSNFKCIRRVVKIGNYLMMAEDVLFLGGGHEFDNTDVPMMYQGSKEKSPLEIGDDVWIGARVMVLPGCKHIGKGVIIN